MRIEAEARVEARDYADLVIIRQHARNPVTDVEIRVDDAAEDECVSLVWRASSPGCVGGWPGQRETPSNRTLISGASGHAARKL